MNARMLVVATLAALALPGCLVRPGHVRGEVSVGATVEIDHPFVYFPSHQVYYSESTSEWWVMGGGGWVSTRVRPAGLVITADTPWVGVDVQGVLPQVRFEAVSREYPADWKAKGPKGPPPGRGWRK